MLEKGMDLSIDSHGQRDFEVIWRILLQNQWISAKKNKEK